jgi:DNA-binding response OmpR family regulator
MHYIWRAGTHGAASLLRYYTCMPISIATQQSAGKTILVLDDEAEVRKLVATTLTKSGYKVLTADTGENAIKTFKKSKQPVDLVLLDVVSPGLSGPMVAERIAEWQPGQRVMFMSGYHETNVVQRYVIEKGYVLLRKPFSIAELTLRVREALDSPLAIPAIQP